MGRLGYDATREYVVCVNGHHTYLSIESCVLLLECPRHSLVAGCPLREPVQLLHKTTLVTRHFLKKAAVAKLIMEIDKFV